MARSALIRDSSLQQEASAGLLQILREIGEQAGVVGDRQEGVKMVQVLR